MRENKVSTAHAEKNALTKLGGQRSHPGIIKLQWTFQDDWSLCESDQQSNFISLVHRLPKISCSTWHQMAISRPEYQSLVP